jgi:tripartite-type tricarboxylate transporter receptor subunit TctC
MKRRLGLILVMMGLLTSAANAQNTFPQRPIKLVVGFAAGGVSDVMARMLAPELQKALGQPVLVENKPGASGIIGADFVAKSPPDGYTLYVAPNTHLINHAMNPNIPFHAVKDFTGITLLTTTPNLLVVNANTPWKTLADYVRSAKSDPGGLAYATSGAGTTVHLAGELLAHHAGIKLNHIPYKGANQSIEAVIAGQVPSSVSAISSSLAFIKAGRVRVLGVMSEKRSPLLPDAPTMAELGYPQVLSDTWIGILGPAGMPPAVSARLNEEFTKLLQRPEIRERILGIGNEPVGMSLGTFQNQMAKELDTYIQLVQSANIKIQ